jgi:hypothetical protein
LIGRQGVKEDRHSWPVGKSLSQQLYLLGCQFQLSIDHAGNVAARPRKACHIPTRDRIKIDGHNNDGNEASCSGQRLQRHFRPKRDHNIRPWTHQVDRSDEGPAWIVYRLIVSGEILALAEAGFP